MTINEMCKAAHKNAVEKGFYENRYFNVGEKLMLIVSELGEALEADRKNRRVAKHINAYDIIAYGSNDRGFETVIKDTFEDELADAVIRIGDLAAACNIDLEAHVKAKMAYNSRRQKRHGKAY